MGFYEQHGIFICSENFHYLMCNRAKLNHYSNSQSLCRATLRSSTDSMAVCRDHFALIYTCKELVVIDIDLAEYGIILNQVNN